MLRINWSTSPKLSQEVRRTKAKDVNINLKYCVSSLNKGEENIGQTSKSVRPVTTRKFSLHGYKNENKWEKN